MSESGQRSTCPSKDGLAREKIVAAALIEFVEHGFAGASTNAIARRAGVAKGLIFHYFATKEQLYLTLVDQAIDRLVQAFYESTGAGANPSPDLFERMLHWSMCKLRLFQANPLLYQLVAAAFADPPPQVREELLKRNQALYREGWMKLLEGIDTSRFRPSVSPDKAVEVLLLVLNGLAAKYLPRLNQSPDRGLGQLEKLTAEAASYLEILRDGVYRR